MKQQQKHLKNKQGLTDSADKIQCPFVNSQPQTKWEYQNQGKTGKWLYDEIFELLLKKN